MDLLLIPVFHSLLLHSSAAPVLTAKGASSFPGRVSREPTSYSLNNRSQKRKPRSYQRLFGDYETQQKTDLEYQLADYLMYIRSFSCSGIVLLHAVLHSLLFFAQVFISFHICLN